MKKKCSPNRISTLPSLLAVGAAFKIVVVAGSSSDYSSSGDDTESEFVFSSAFLDDYCSVAQMIVAQTSLSSTNVVFEGLGISGNPFAVPPIPSTEFIASSPLPHDGEVSPMSDLTTTQFVGFGHIEDDDGSRSGDHGVGAQTIMCKMKTGEALDSYFSDGEDGNNCTDVQEYIYNLVLKGLDDSHDSTLLPPIEYLNWVTYSGQQWTDGAPSPSAFTNGTDSLILVSKELKVTRTLRSSFIAADKKGVHYCQTIAPEYLRNLLEGIVTAPTCAYPPEYEDSTGGLPGPPKVWDCDNNFRRPRPMNERTKGNYDDGESVLINYLIITSVAAVVAAMVARLLE